MIILNHVKGPHGWTETFSDHTIDVLHRMGLIEEFGRHTANSSDRCVVTVYWIASGETITIDQTIELRNLLDSKS